MPPITVQTNVADTARRLDAKAIRQLPFIRSLALNRTAQIIKPGMIQVMKQRFDRPTPYTLNSLRIVAADRKQAVQEAKVHFKDDSYKGTPATKFLTPGMYGGPRGHKRFEKALISKGLMKSDQFAMPASGAKLDAYGNMQRGQIVQILSALKAFGEQGYMANRTASRRSAKKGTKAPYFVGDPVGLGTGVWKRTKADGGTMGGGVEPVLVFGKQPRYRVRVPFEKIAGNMARKHLPLEFSKAFDHAMKTSR